MSRLPARRQRHARAVERRPERRSVVPRRRKDMLGLPHIPEVPRVTEENLKETSAYIFKLYGMLNSSGAALSALGLKDPRRKMLQEYMRTVSRRIELTMPRLTGRLRGRAISHMLNERWGVTRLNIGGIRIFRLDDSFDTEFRKSPGERAEPFRELRKYVVIPRRAETDDMVKLIKSRIPGAFKFSTPIMTVNVSLGKTPVAKGESNRVSITPIFFDIMGT